MYKGKITDISGLLVGHAQVDKTGVTVLLAKDGAISGVDVRGGAPGTRETDTMSMARTVKHAHAILISGGSAFGLCAADGVMKYCEENNIGIKTQDACVPIVPSAVIYDLAHKGSRPTAQMGYLACSTANKDFAQGAVGAGTGASIGKIMGFKNAQQGGIGSASISINGVTVGALVCVNSFGDVLEGNKIIAGAKLNSEHINTEEYILQNKPITDKYLNENTTIGIIATDARLTRDDVTRLAQSAQDGFARAINPVHTPLDGDTIFALSYGDKSADINILCVAAAEAMRRAIVNAALISNNV